jgi:2-polyprenyl-3-methyl-5-hydroxy-6-metoxy-1,4-benzoquinol methylase
MLVGIRRGGRPVTQTDTHKAQRRDAFVDKLIGDTIATFELMGTYLGLRLGLYRALDAGGPATAAELAARAGIDQRYAREWLEQQAVAGVLEVASDPAGHDERVYGLPSGYGDVLVDELNPYYVAPLAYAAGVGGVLPQLVDAYRTGAGVPFSAYGADIRDHIEQLNRPMFINELGSVWLPAIPELDTRLSADPPARVLDIACGAGWSSIALALAYPYVRVDGLDLDEASIARASKNADAAGVGDRVTFRVQDASDLALSDSYDAVFIFEALHDMAQPVVALAAARDALRPEGSVIVADEKVGEQFAAPGDQIERLMYGFSITHCLPAGRPDANAVATGTVMRPDTLRAYAQQAGFSTVEVLPIANDMWRFYRLSD